MIQQESGISTATIVFGGIFLLAVGGGLWYLLTPSKTTARLDGYNEAEQTAWAANPNNPANQQLPTAGTQAVGVLTDPNFFKGLTDFSKTIAGLIQEGKNAKLTQSNVSNTASNFGSTNSGPQAKPATYGFNPLLT